MIGCTVRSPEAAQHNRAVPREELALFEAEHLHCGDDPRDTAMNLERRRLMARCLADDYLLDELVHELSPPINSAPELVVSNLAIMPNIVDFPNRTDRPER